MPTIELETSISAPIERVFDLARSIDLHIDSACGTGERAVAGVTSGLIGPGQEVTWRARHFGVWQSLSVRINAFHRPTHFTDVMLRGPFRRMEHQHHFLPLSGDTIMRDVFIYESPFGILGRIADVLFLERHMRCSSSSGTRSSRLQLSRMRGFIMSRIANERSTKPR